MFMTSVQGSLVYPNHVIYCLTLKQFRNAFVIFEIQRRNWIVAGPNGKGRWVWILTSYELSDCEKKNI